jgi:hypothetical protein
MKKSLQDQLKAYSAIAGSMAATAGGAQIVYTDVNPDFVAHDTIVYFLDLNNDTIPDFMFAGYDVQTSYGQVGLAVTLPYDTANGILGSLYYGVYPMPYALNNGDSIRPNSPMWNDTINGGYNYLGVLYPGPYTYGNWVGVNDKYIGLRIKVNGQYHYGWARLSVNAGSDSIIIKDYAYEVLPNVGLTAGQLVGIQAQANPAGIRVHAYQHTAFVHVPNPQDGGMISIYDMSGKLIRQVEITSGDMTIDLGDQPAGIYMIHVQQGESTISQKIYTR